MAIVRISDGEVLAERPVLQQPDFAVFGPDGSLVTAGARQPVRFFHGATGRLGHTSAVRSVAIVGNVAVTSAPEDGVRFISGKTSVSSELSPISAASGESQDSPVAFARPSAALLWDVAQGAALRRGPAPVYAVSPDGSRGIAQGSAPGLLDLVSGAALEGPRILYSPLLFAWSPDNTWLAWASGDTVGRLPIQGEGPAWRRSPDRRYEREPIDFGGLAVSPDGMQVAASVARGILLFDARTGMITTLAEPPSERRFDALGFLGTDLLVASLDSQLQVLQVPSGNVVRTVDVGPMGELRVVGRSAYVLAGNARVVRVDLDTGGVSVLLDVACLRPEGTGQSLTALGVSGDGTTLLVGVENGAVIRLAVRGGA